MALALLLPLTIKFRRELKRLVWFLAPIGIIVLGYFGVNYLHFGTLMPISGAVKLDSLYMALAQNPGWQFVITKLAFIFGPFHLGSPIYKILIQLFAFVTPAYLIVRQVRGKILTNRELVLLGLGSFLLLKYLAYTTIYNNWRTEAYWYWVVDVIIWCVIIAAILRYFLEKLRGTQYGEYGRKMLPALIAVALTITVGWGSYARTKQPAKPIRDTSILLDLAQFVANHDYFADKRLGAYNAGILGYFSGRQLTNLDGLINSPAFAKLIRTGQRDTYIKENIDILVEYHGAYVQYYTGLGFSMYTIREFIKDAVPFDPKTGDDYRVYVRSDLKNEFEEFLRNLPKA